jgi:metal-sulfur cluster biosynthetic enzyme
MKRRHKILPSWEGKCHQCFAIESEMVIIKITPTYSGCPAMNAIEMEIQKNLKKKGSNISEF